MVQQSENYIIKYAGSGKAAESFPVPFPFRHSANIHVETISLSGTISRKVEDTHYTLVKKRSTGQTDVAFRGEYGWVTWIGVSPTDTIHIYREETLVQGYSYSDAVNVPEGAFEDSLDRLVDPMSSQIARSNADPSMYSANGRKLPGVSAAEYGDDALDYTSLVDTAADDSALTIPLWGGVTNVRWLTPTDYLPTPSVGWLTKLELLSTDGVDSLSVLSPTATYSVAPFIEWTLPRWVISPPGDIYRYVYSYGTGDAIEGEGTTKSARWREFREMPTLLTEVTDVNKVIRLKSFDYVPSPAISSEINTASCPYEAVSEPLEENEVTRDLRMIASEGGSLVGSPRMKRVRHTLPVRFDEDGGGPRTVTHGGVEWIVNHGNGDGTIDGTDVPGGASVAMLSHPFYPFLISNTLKDDSDGLTMPHMVFIQVHSPISGTAYPVFRAQMWPIINEAGESSDQQKYILEDATSAGGWLADDATSNNHILGGVDMMNCNAYAQPAADGTGDASATNAHDSIYLNWSGEHTIYIDVLLVYGDILDF